MAYPKCSVSHNIALVFGEVGLLKLYCVLMGSVSSFGSRFDRYVSFQREEKKGKNENLLPPYSEQ